MKPPPATYGAALTDEALSDTEEGLNTAQRRKRASRERMLSAAAVKFLDHGYLAVTVDDIATAAGVSRMTFYRHFSGKVDLLLELFLREGIKTRPTFCRIAQQDFRDRATVRAWLSDFFELDRANRRLLGVFNQVIAEEPGFTEKAQEWINSLIEGLCTGIPAFAVRPDHPDERRQWLEAWLLIYEILDHSNHAARNSGISSDPLVIDILVDRFLSFVDK